MIADTRNGYGKSVSVELQTEFERNVGVDGNGVQQYVYIANTPTVIKKTTYNVLGTPEEWVELFERMADNYSSVTTIFTGLVLESVNPSGGKLIMNNKEYLSGSYIEADYGNVVISTPPTEYNITTSKSASISPSGFLPNSGLPYYNSRKYGVTTSRNSTCSLSLANSYKVGTSGPFGLITSKNISSPKKINNMTYVSLSLQMVELKSSITI